MGVEANMFGFVLFACVFRLDPEVSPELYYDNETGQWDVDGLYINICILHNRVCETATTCTALRLPGSMCDAMGVGNKPRPAGAEVVLVREV